TYGMEPARKIHEMSEENWDFIIKTNTRSTFLGCKHAISQFLSQQPLHPHPSSHTKIKGWIINTASILSFVGLKGGAGAYCASKGAVVQLTKQIAVEYGAEKIHCNALCPGYLKTPMTAQFYDDEKTRKEVDATMPWGGWGRVEDVAKCAVFLASDDAAYVTGLPMVIDGGYTAQ
ncbi:hypothetical protein Q9189_007840, partial [Teloschistes chrysophthalmus]